MKKFKPLGWGQKEKKTIPQFYYYTTKQLLNGSLNKNLNVF